MILMSAKHPKAEVARRRWHFRFVPQPEVAMPVVGAVHSIKNGHSELFFSLHGSTDRCVFAVLFNEKVGGAVDIDVGGHVQGRFRAMRNPLL